MRAPSAARAPPAARRRRSTNRPALGYRGAEARRAPPAGCRPTRGTDPLRKAPAQFPRAPARDSRDTGRVSELGIRDSGLGIRNRIRLWVPIPIAAVRGGFRRGADEMAVPFRIDFDARVAVRRVDQPA